MASGRRGSSGWPLLEWALVLVVTGVMVAVIDLRVSGALEVAEQRAFDLQLQNFNTGLRLQIAERLIRQQAMDDLARDPVQLLQSPPANWRGTAPASSEFERPAWFYDPQAAALVYLPQRREKIAPLLDRLVFSVDAAARNPAAATTMAWRSHRAFVWNDQTYSVASAALPTKEY